MHMTGSEERLFGILLSSFGLSYQDTPQGIYIQDSNGKPYQDKQGRICYFEGTSDALDAISWVFNVRDVPYRTFSQPPTGYMLCLQTYRENEDEYWTAGEWYEYVKDGDIYHLETNTDVWGCIGKGYSIDESELNKFFKVHTKEEYEHTLNYGTYDYMGEIHLPDDLYDYN